MSNVRKKVWARVSVVLLVSCWRLGFCTKDPAHNLIASFHSFASLCQVETEGLRSSCSSGSILQFPFGLMRNASGSAADSPGKRDDWPA